MLSRTDGLVFLNSGNLFYNEGLPQFLDERQDKVIKEIKTYHVPSFLSNWKKDKELFINNKLHSELKFSKRPQITINQDFYNVTDGLVKKELELTVFQFRIYCEGVDDIVNYYPNTPGDVLKNKKVDFYKEMGSVILDFGVEPYHLTVYKNQIKNEIREIYEKNLSNLEEYFNVFNEKIRSYNSFLKTRIETEFQKRNELLSIAQSIIKEYE